MLFLSRLCFFAASVEAFRRTQYVRPDDPTYQAFSVVSVHNETTAHSDLYIRFQAAWYESSARGWSAFAFGTQMRGALMFVIYGDPTTSPPQLTLSVRTASGNHAPHPIDFSEHDLSVEILHAGFNRNVNGTSLSAVPSHIGLADVIVRSYDTWHSAAINPTSNKQSMFWANNPDQDFAGDLALDASLQQHQYNTKGFMWADLGSAVAPEGFVASIHDAEGNLGVDESGFPASPNEEELRKGEESLASIGGQHASHQSMPSPSPQARPSQNTQSKSQAGASKAAAKAAAKAATNKAVDVPGQLTWQRIPLPTAQLLVVVSWAVLSPIAVLIRIRTPIAKDAPVRGWVICQLAASLCAVSAVAIGTGGLFSAEPIMVFATVGAQVTQTIVGCCVTLRRQARSPSTWSYKIYCALDWTVLLLASSTFILALLGSPDSSKIMAALTLLLVLEVALVAVLALTQPVQHRRPSDLD